MSKPVCQKCKREMKCLHCFQSKGGSVEGPTKARDSAAMKRAAKIRWEKHRAKWHKHMESVAESTK